MGYKEKRNNIVIILLLVTSCSYYSLKGSLPAGVNSIFISNIVNDTSEFIISDKLSQIFSTDLLNKNILQITTSDIADSQIDITITKITDKPFSIVSNNFQSELVEKWKITVYINIIWHNIDTGDEIINKKLNSWAAYGTGQDIGNDGIDNDSDNLIDSADSDEFGLPRESALRIAIEKLSEKIINEITSTW